MRLIDADAIQIPSTYVDMFENCRNCKLLDEDQVREIIDNAPTIEPKRGEWINQHKWPNGFFERECSVCGAMKPSLRHTAKINFCPNCGARMKGADDELLR